MSSSSAAAAPGGRGADNGEDDTATTQMRTTTTTTTTKDPPPPKTTTPISTTTPTTTTTSTIADQRAKAACTFRESLLPGIDITMDLHQMHYSHTSPYQQIDIVTTPYGKTLVTDGKTQSAAFDEYVYHESLVHPALLSLLADDDGGTGGERRLKTVFIGGGGELATAREVLRYRCVERVVMVDLDVKVIDACKEHLPEWGGDSVYSHPKFHLVIGDAYEYLMSHNNNNDHNDNNHATNHNNHHHHHHERFDAIIMDISDPIESGPGNMLYTKEFYEHVAVNVLQQPHGVLVTQAGMAESVPSASYMTGIADPSCHAPIYNTLRSVFTAVHLYTTNIPSFGSDWGYVMASNNSNHNHTNQHNHNQQHQHQQPRTIEQDERSCDIIDELIERHIEGGARALRHYDAITHCKMFLLTKPLRTHMDNDQRIITKDHPIYMF
jgi:thermospermine synthase